MQRAGDAGALSGLAAPNSARIGHEAGHLVLGEHDLLAAEVGEGEVGDLEVKGGRGHNAPGWSSGLQASTSVASA